jgi:hypothetical protein
MPKNEQFLEPGIREKVGSFSAIAEEVGFARGWPILVLGWFYCLLFRLIINFI